MITDKSAPVLRPHDHYMKIALVQAQMAFDEDEVPVGAVLVGENGDIIATAHNQTISRNDPSAHAEILAIRSAGEKLKNYRFVNTSLYVTVEPCVMCMGAIIHARIACVIFGVNDPKWGGAGSLYNFQTNDRFNHHPQIIKGIYEEQCGRMMVNFFKLKRDKNLDA